MTQGQHVMLALAVMLPLAALAQASPPQWSGRWRLEERQTTLRLYVSPDGAAQAEVVASPHREEVGTHALRDLKWDQGRKQWAGELVMADVGRAGVTVRFVDRDTLEMVAGRWFLKKTLQLTRVAETEVTP